MRPDIRIFSLGMSVVVGMVLGCGSGGGGGIPSSSPGTGSGTLLVQATVNADDLNGNGSNSPANFKTDLVVDVSKGGQPVTGAAVRMGTSLGTFTLVDQADGTYTYTYSGYSQVHTLSVISATDTISGAQIAGPDLHRIVFPVQNGSYGLNQTMTATWQRAAQAQEIDISTRDCNSAVPGTGMPQAVDSGSYNLPGDLCFDTARSDQRVTIKRTNKVSLAGGTSGSEFRATVRNQVEPITIK